MSTLSPHRLQGFLARRFASVSLFISGQSSLHELRLIAENQRRPLSRPFDGHEVSMPSQTSSQDFTQFLMIRSVSR